MRHPGRPLLRTVESPHVPSRHRLCIFQDLPLMLRHDSKNYDWSGGGTLHFTGHGKTCGMRKGRRGFPELFKSDDLLLLSTFSEKFPFFGVGRGGGIPLCGDAAGFHQICTIFRTHWNVSTWRKSLWIVFWEQAPHLANTCKMTKGHCLTHILISHEVRSVEICEFTDLEGEKSPCLHFT